MGLFSKKIKIQATEGSKSPVEIDSLMYGRSYNVDVPGVVNDYETYESQVMAVYKKYNAFSQFGASLTRSVIDLRTSFISGEGISVSCKNEQTAKWIEKFIQENKLQGSGLVEAVKSSELTGQTLFTLNIVDNKETVLLRRYRYNYSEPYRAVYADKNYMDEIKEVQIKKDIGWVKLALENFLYVRTGGDDSNLYGPTTKTGVVLTDIDNYDRAIKDIRRNNHIFARVTPVFEVTSETEARNLKAWLQSIKWKIGTAFIGKAKFSYESPKTSAYQNLVSELTSTIKTISGTTGVPVHWLGYVDLMSNRSTADSLYENIKNATISERITWEESLYELILKAQELYIDNGGTDLTYNSDFSIKLPLIDFNKFVERIRALSQAYADNAISMDDYRNAIPGIDPLVTERAVLKEQADQEQELVRMGLLNQNEEESTDGKE